MWLVSLLYKKRVNDSLCIFIAVSAAIVIPCVFFIIHICSKAEEEFKCNSGLYTKIDNEHLPDERVAKIDELYGNHWNVSNLISNGEIFSREAFLLTKLEEESHEKECWVSIISIILAAVLASFLSGELMDIKIGTLSGTFLQCAILSVFVLIVSGGTYLLLNAILSEEKSNWDQIRKYELRYIDKVLGAYMNCNLPSSVLKEKCRIVRTCDRERKCSRRTEYYFRNSSHNS